MRLDRRGAIGLPVRLAVAFLILSVSVPVLTGVAADLEDGSSVASATQEAGRIADAVGRVYYMGEGSVRTVEVHLPPGCMLSLGGSGAGAYSIGVHLDDAERGRVYLERPPVRLLGEGIEVHGSTVLSVACLKSGGIYGVEVGFLD